MSNVTSRRIRRIVRFCVRLKPILEIASQLYELKDLFKDLWDLVLHLLALLG
jgi:hypothetical protein